MKTNTDEFNQYWQLFKTLVNTEAEVGYAEMWESTIQDYINFNREHIIDYDEVLEEFKTREFDRYGVDDERCFEMYALGNDLMVKNVDSLVELVGLILMFIKQGFITWLESIHILAGGFRAYDFVDDDDQIEDKNIKKLT